MYLTGYSKHALHQVHTTTAARGKVIKDQKVRLLFSANPSKRANHWPYCRQVQTSVDALCKQANFLIFDHCPWDQKVQITLHTQSQTRERRTQRIGSRHLKSTLWVAGDPQVVGGHGDNHLLSVGVMNMIMVVTWNSSQLQQNNRVGWILWSACQKGSQFLVRCLDAS